MVSTRHNKGICPAGGEGGGESSVVSRSSRHTAPSSLTSPGPSSNQEPPSCTSNTNFFDLPIECIEHIFSYIGYNKVSQIRLVSKQFDQVCSEILNSTFQKLQNQMQIRFQKIKAMMPRRESARRNHPLACESDIIETLHMRLTLLQMSFGKHIERKHICFFPGEILDEVYRILNYIKVTPKLGRPYKVTDELFDLSTMAMEYFKDRIEPCLPEIAYFCPDIFGLSVDSPPHGLGKGDESPLAHHLDDGTPQTGHPVLVRRLQKLSQGLKRYKYQLGHVRKEVRCSRGKMAEQQKQMNEYASRLDEYDKKHEETNRKFSTMLQELNKCSTELQYWRSKSPISSTWGSPAEVIEPIVEPLPPPPPPPPVVEAAPVVVAPPEPVAGTSNDQNVFKVPAGPAEQRNKRKSATETPPSKKQRSNIKSRNKRV